MSDDSQLTAYALGELDQDARREVEERLAVDPAARAEVAALERLADEARVMLRRREQVDGMGVVAGPWEQPARHRGWLLAFGLIAAALVMAAVVWASRDRDAPTRRVHDPKVLVGGVDASVGPVAVIGSDAVDSGDTRVDQAIAAAADSSTGPAASDVEVAALAAEAFSSCSTFFLSSMIKAASVLGLAGRPPAEVLPGPTLSPKMSPFLRPHFRQLIRLAKLR